MKFLSEDGCDYVEVAKAIMHEDSMCIHTFEESLGYGNLIILHNTKAEKLARFILECLSENKGYSSDEFLSEDRCDCVNISRLALANKGSIYVNTYEECILGSNTVILRDTEAEKLARFILEVIPKKK